MKSDRVPSRGPNILPIDRSILRILEEDVADNDPDVMLELIDIFIHDSRWHLQEIAKVLEQQEFRKIEISAHSLKSSSATFGAMALAGLSARLEQLARDKKMEGIVELLYTAREEFARVEEILMTERTKWVETASK